MSQEFEIIKKNIDTLILLAGDLQQIRRKDMNISGDMTIVANYLMNLRAIKSSAEMCRIAIEKYEQDNAIKSQEGENCDYLKPHSKLNTQ